MRESTPIPVRFSLEIIQRLENAAKKMNLGSRTAVVKMCVASFLEDFEKNGVAGLPLNWRQIIHDLDGRSQRYNNINVVAHQSVVNGGVINNHPPSSRKRSGKPRRKGGA